VKRASITFGSKRPTRRLFATLAVIVTGCFVDVAVAAQAPALPQYFLDTTMPQQFGTTITVPAGGDLQAALNSAQGGDTIVLQAGATYTGPFTLPVKPNNGWIVVRTSAPDSALPPPGTRIDPSYVNVMATLTSSINSIITASSGAHHFRFVGIEITPPKGVYLINLVQLGGYETSTSQLPSALAFDRCYVHGDPVLGARRGIAMNSATTAVFDSYFSDFKDSADSQAIGGWNGSGPYKIVNNYLEAASENIMFGGMDPTIPNLIPSDIEIRQNFITKPLSWYPNDPSYDGSRWTVKNALELKNAQRVLVDGNVLEHVWNAAQPGFIIVLTPVNQSGGCPWCTVQDLTFTNNVIRHSSGGFNIVGRQSSTGIQQRVKIENNLFDDIDPTHWGNGNGTFLLVQNGVSDLVVNHNTLAFSPVNVVDVTGPNVSPSFVFTNTIVTHGTYGVRSYSTIEGTATLNTWFPGSVFDRNVVFGSPTIASRYPADNFFPASVSDVGFVNPVVGGDFELSATSPFKNGATDGKDIGIDGDALYSALSATDGGTAGGNTFSPPTPTPTASPTPTPTPAPDTVAPSVTITSPSSGAMVAGGITVAIAATDNVGVATTKYYVDGNLVGAFSPAQFSLAWNSTSVTDGTHTVTVTTYDAAGNSSQASVSIVVRNDQTPPTVAITSPSPGSRLNKTTKVTVTASDNVVVRSVSIYVDTTLIGTVTPNKSAYSGTVSFNAGKLSRGTHSISATATDGVGNTSRTSISVIR
jgi:hypothetical protein